MADQVDVSLWAVCYLHDWDAPREDGSQPIYPEVHRLYATAQEAEGVREKLGDGYHVRRAHLGTFRDGVDGFARHRLSHSAAPPEARDAVIEECAAVLDGRAAMHLESHMPVRAEECEIAATALRSLKAKEKQ